MGRNSANICTHRPADGSICCWRRRARGWGGRWGVGTAVGGGRRQKWLVKWVRTWPKHKTSQRFQNTRKINATTYQMTRVDESFEGRWVVRQEEGRLWSYGGRWCSDGKSHCGVVDGAAMEVGLVTEFSCALEGQTDCARFFVGCLLSSWVYITVSCLYIPSQ